MADEFKNLGRGGEADMCMGCYADDTKAQPSRVFIAALAIGMVAHYACLCLCETHTAELDEHMSDLASKLGLSKQLIVEAIVQKLKSVH